MNAITILRGIVNAKEVTLPPIMTNTLLTTLKDITEYGFEIPLLSKGEHLILESDTHDFFDLIGRSKNSEQLIGLFFDEVDICKIVINSSASLDIRIKN